MSGEPAQRRPLNDTPTGPGIAAWRSLRHAWGTLSTAIARLEQEPPDWPTDQTVEARAQLQAAQELIKSVGEAIRQAQSEP